MTYGSGLWGAINMHAQVKAHRHVQTQTYSCKEKLLWLVALSAIHFSEDNSLKSSSAVKDTVRGVKVVLLGASATSTLQSESCHNTAVRVRVCVCVREKALRGTLIRALRLRKSHRHNTTTQTDRDTETDCLTHGEAAPVEGNCNGKMKTEKLPQHLCAKRD